MRAQERVTEAERDYVSSLLTYNLSMVNLKRANGTLLQSENINADMACENGCKEIYLSKGDETSGMTQDMSQQQLTDQVLVPQATHDQPTPVGEPDYYHK